MKDVNFGQVGRNRYKLDIRSVNNYYPFGMLMPDMSWQSSGYRYGFGGHEMDNDVKGTGNHSSFGDYGYDPRVGRRFSIDPDYFRYPGYSPYHYGANNPIIVSDPDGKKWQLSTFHFNQNDIENFKNVLNIVFDGTAEIKIDENGFVDIKPVDGTFMNYYQSRLFDILIDVTKPTEFVVQQMLAPRMNTVFIDAYRLPIEGVTDQKLQPGVIDVGDLLILSQNQELNPFVTASIGHIVFEQYLRKTQYWDYENMFDNPAEDNENGGYPRSHSRALGKELFILGYEKRNDYFKSDKYLSDNTKDMSNGEWTIKYTNGSKFLSYFGLSNYEETKIKVRIQNGLITNIEFSEKSSYKKGYAQSDNPLVPKGGKLPE